MEAALEEARRRTSARAVRKLTTVVDGTIAAFASAYADQNDADFEAYRQAIADGRVEAHADG